MIWSKLYPNTEGGHYYYSHKTDAENEVSNFISNKGQCLGLNLGCSQQCSSHTHHLFTSSGIRCSVDLSTSQ